MNVVVEGYFSRIDAKGNIRLVNLEPESMKKLRNCEKAYFSGQDVRSPVLANGLIIKHDTTAIVHNIDGIPTSTLKLLGHKVKVSVKTRKYKFQSDEEIIIGWSVKLKSMNPI